MVALAAAVHARRGAGKTEASALAATILDRPQEREYNKGVAPSPAPQPVRLRDIAAKAGVSTTTVSLALRGDPSVAAATRARLTQLAQAMGYRRDPALAALAEYRRKRGRVRETIAIVKGREPPVPIPDDFRATVWEAGFGIDDFVLPESPEEQRRLSRVLRSRGIRGILLHASRQKVREIALEWEHFAVVDVQGKTQRQFLHTVTTNFFDSMGVILAELAAMGCRQAGLVFTRSVPMSVQWRGAYAAMHEDIMQRTPVLAYDTGRYFDEGEDASVAAWIEEHRLDSVIVVNRSTAEWPLTRYLKNAHERGEIVCCFTNCAPDAPYPGLVQQPARIWHAGLELLQDMLRANRLGPVEHPYSVQIRGVWHAGKDAARVTPTGESD